MAKNVSDITATGGVITEHDVIYGFSPKRFTGRRIITTPFKEITSGNIVQILSDTQSIHARNRAETEYLYRVYRGWQDIQDKVREVRERNNNIVCVNRANEIVTFKTAYLLSEAIQYISHGGDETVSRNVALLNDFMRADDKESKDKELVDWMHICGYGIKLVLPVPAEYQDEHYAPFYTAVLDPRSAYVIHSADIQTRPIAGVINLKDESGEDFCYVYTRNKCYTVKGDSVTETPTPDFLIPPLIEYAANMPRLGAFEPVLSMLNAINTLESNAIDAVEDHVNAYDVFQDCEIKDGEYSGLSDGGKAVQIYSKTPGITPKVYRVTSELNQSGVQTRIDDLTDAYLTICGMPNRNGGTSTSDTGTAVLFRDGWSEAESRAKDTEKYFIRSERNFMRVVLQICKSTSQLQLNPPDIDISFARKSLSNAQSKIQSLIQMLENSYIHPHSAFQVYGDVFGDPEKAYRMGQEWHDELEKAQEADAERELEKARLSAQNNTQTNSENGETVSGSATA